MMAIEVNQSGSLVEKTTKLTTVDLAAVNYEQVVEGFGGEDIISIPGGKVTGAVIRGDDIVLKTDIGVNVRIKNAKGHFINVIDEDGNHYRHYGGYYTYRPIDVIQSFMASLDKTTLSGSKALDEAIKSCSSKWSTIKDAIASCVADCKAAGDANTFLRKYCGIELTDYDTGAITGWDAANAYSKDADEIVPESGSMKTFSGTSFTANGLKLTVPSKLTDVQQTIINGLYTWWAEEGLNLVADSYGDNYSFTNASSATVKEMKVEFTNDKKGGYLALVRYAYDAKTGKTATLTMQINMYYYNSLASDNVNGESNNNSAGYLDRTLAHEFTHAVMAANINHFNALPNFIAEGMAELTHGIDDQRTNDILTLAGNSSKLSSNLNVKDTKSSKSSIYAAGYIFLRYLAKQSAIFEKDYVEVFDWDDPPYAEEGSDGVRYSDSKYTRLIIDDFTGVVDATDFNAKLVTLDAATDDQFVVLLGNKNGNVLRAGSEGSSLDGGLGADKLYGGAGADTFSYSVGGGNDAIYNYKASDGDVVQIFGATSVTNAITKASFKESGKNVVLTVGSGKTKGTITFNAPDGRITLIDGNGDTIATFNDPLPNGVGYNKNKTAVTLSSGAAISDGSTLDLSDYASTTKDVNAAKFEKAINIIGNATANNITIGSGGGTLNGGLGNDKLIGGDGADVFVYSVGGGNDVIEKFNGKNGDYVIINGVTSIDGSKAAKWSGNNLTVTVGKGKLTLNDPQGVIRFVDGNGNLLYSAGVDFPDGVGYNKNKTAITIDSSASGVDEIDLSGTSYATTVKDINASKYGGKINIVGNAQANNITIGSGGGTLNGGLGADKLYGGAGSDTFVYSVGGGADQIYNFNGSGGDVVQILGAASVTGAISKASFKESGKNVVLTVGSGKTKGTITFNSPNGRITLIDGNGDTIATFNDPLPSGVGYNKNKTAVTLSSGAVIDDGGTLDLSNYATTVKDINASKYGAAINIIGNANANNITIGSGGGTLSGGHSAKASADKLYGGSGSDVFYYADGDGSDQIYNYNYGDGDVVKISGTVKKAAVSGKNVALTVGKGTLTINNVVDKTVAIDINGTVENYQFTKTNNTLAKAKVATNSQLPADVLFDNNVDDDPIGSILDIKSTAVDETALLEKPVDHVFSRSNDNLIISARRNRQQ